MAAVTQSLCLGVRAHFSSVATQRSDIELKRRLQMLLELLLALQGNAKMTRLSVLHLLRSKSTWAAFHLTHDSHVLFLLPAVAVTYCLGLKCKEHQYPFGEKCCSDCAPGERMKDRCSATADTVCVPCQDEFFSSEHHHSFCNSCTICQTRKGSVEVKKCEKTSDRVCMCRAGYMPVVGRKLGSVCTPCPEGSYSIGRNENCQPWTNCSILGKNTLRPGTKTADAVCSNHVPQAAASPSATPASSLSTTARRNNTSAVEFSPSGPSVVPFLCSDTNSPTATNWGSLSLILICLILLMVSGMSILLLIIQAAKKGTKRKPCKNNRQERSFRIPIQEEQVDSNSSLIKN